jgi:hypothetical protein
MILKACFFCIPVNSALRAAGSFYNFLYKPGRAPDCRTAVTTAYCPGSGMEKIAEYRGA